MRLQFDQIPETIIPNMRGGEGQVAFHTYEDSKSKIMLGCLMPHSSIGLHIHDTSSETIYILSGTGKVLCNGVYEPLSAGDCHYCPQGHQHSLINDGDGELRFFAVVPQHGA